MKIAISSDWHGKKPQLNARKTIQKCDILLLCGDIFENWENESLEKYLKSLVDSGIKVIMTPGNHDWNIFASYIDSHPLDNVNTYYPYLYNDGLTLDYIQNKIGIKVLIDEEYEINGVRIYGTPWSPQFGHWAFMPKYGECGRFFSKIPENVDILITHTPPKTDVSLIDSCEQVMYDGQEKHLGSIDLYNAIVDKRPKYAFCGHIHTGYHGETIIGGTKCHNVSYLDESYKPAFDIFVLEM